MEDIKEAIFLLDKMITTKQNYLNKKPNPFVQKEMDDLSSIAKTLNKSEHIISTTQLSYSLLLKNYEIDFHGKIDPDNSPSLEEWKDTLKRLTSTDKIATDGGQG